ncbi:MAG TPA: outer membrane protein assembly factor BamE [Telluria sp.]|jgi:outer membrane protein assembly factor BamE
MPVDTAVLHRFSLRAPLVATLAGAVLSLSGCTMFGGTKDPVVPVSATPDAGAQTVQASKLQKFLWIFSPYRPDIQQGNFISQEMLTQLKVGQTREQVKFLLGTPLLTDIFHADRWDFPFYLARGDGELTSSRVTVYFKDNKVEKFDGGNLPTEKEYIARIAGPSKVAAKLGPKKEEVGAVQIKIKQN